MNPTRSSRRRYLHTFFRWLDGSVTGPLRRRDPRPTLKLEQLEDRTVPSLVTTEVKVINTAGGSSPANYVNFNGTLYFTADDSVNGRGLWKSDGTAAGTTLVQHLSDEGVDNFGRINGSNLTVVGNSMYFFALDVPGQRDRGLWKSDGTTAGTKLVKSGTGLENFGIAPLSTNIAAIGNTVYYIAGDSAHGYELWKSDGTTGGTTMVKDINPGTGSAFAPNYGDPYNPNSVGSTALTVVGSILYFDADNGNGHGPQLWKSDGTAGGTVLVDDLGANANPSNVTDVNGTLFFTATHGTFGWALYKTDGTAAGTSLVKDVQPAWTGQGPTNLTAVGNKLLFTGDDGPHGNELWVSDGTAAGTMMVKDIEPGFVGGLPGAGNSGFGWPDSIVFQSKLYFFATNDGLDNQLWQSDGTAAGTTLFKQMAPTGTKTNPPTNLTIFGSKLVFSGDDGTHGSELWTSDGTTDGTVLVKDINPGFASADPASKIGPQDGANFLVIGPTLYFSADDGIHGVELFKSDGTAAGTGLVKDINLANGDGQITNLTNVNGTLLFTANDDKNGTTLFKSDGTAAGTGILKTINPTGSAVHTDLLARSARVESAYAGSTLFFLANDGVHGDELWKTDGTESGTQLVKDINPGSADGLVSYFTYFTAVGGTVFFEAHDGVHTCALWKSDGTDAGTTFVASVGDAETRIFSMTAMNGLAFFTTVNFQGLQLWKSDGTAAGTVLVKDSMPGSPDLGLTVVGNKLFFVNNSRTTLWESDGTTAGTFILKQITANSLFAYGNTLVFEGADGTHGTELWSSDGTPAGTALLKDINPGPNSGLNGADSNATFAVMGGAFFFEASDPTNGWALWKSDGTTAGTVPIKGGVFSNLTGPLISTGSKLYFSANDFTHGSSVLWESDGTSAGTKFAAQIWPGVPEDAPPIGPVTQVGNTLFFTANDSPTSRQLWAGLLATGVASIGSTTPAGTYGKGAAINVTVTFQSPVTLAGGNLTLTLNDGGVVTITPFTNSSTASGTYTVAPDDQANPLDATSPLTLAAGATLKDGGGNDVALIIPSGRSLKDSRTIVINGATAAITSISSTTPNGTYNTGAAISVTLTFSTPVTLAGGNLTINLNGGGTVKIAPFTSSTTASGTYTVAVGDQANPLDTASPLTLAAGATLKDRFGNNATLVIPAGRSLRDTSAIVVDGVAPAASFTSTTANGRYGVGAAIDVTATFSRPVTLAGGNVTVNLNDGGTVTIAPFTNSATASGTYTVAAGQTANPLDTTSPLTLAAGATLKDGLGNNAALTIPAGQSLRDNKTIVVDTTPPTANITAAPPSLTNSTSANFGFTGSDNVTAPGNLAFQASLDGSAFATTVSPRGYTGLTAGTHTFAVRAVDETGNVGAPASFTWVIDATAPAVSIAPAAGQPDPATVTPVRFAVVFSKPVTGFGATGILIGGTAGGGSVTVAGGGTTYLVNVSGLTRPGAVTATVAAGAAHDQAGNVNPASNSSTVTFTPPAGPAGIRGEVFLDTNGNGLPDANDQPLAGQTVFLDLNNNGVADPGEPTAVTDRNGAYTFSGVAPGTYRVQVQVPAGTVLFTTPPAGVLVVTLAGSDATGRHFGELPASPGVPLFVVPATPSPDGNTAYVKGLYRSILGREPGTGTDPAGHAVPEVQYWVALLGSAPDLAAARAQVARGVWESQEHRAREVDRYYHDFLGRAPGVATAANGVSVREDQYWVGQMLSGAANELQVVTGFLVSGEYQRKTFGDLAFVQGLFTGLGISNNGSNTLTTNGVVVAPLQERQPDGSLNRTQVVKDFLYSDQSLLRIVNAYYYAYLGRAGEPVAPVPIWATPVLPFWVYNLRGSGSPETAGVGILVSEEYVTRVTAVASA